MKAKELKQECLSSRKWIRLIFMVIFAAVSYGGIFLVWLISLFQFLCHLITGKTSLPLQNFSSSLSLYIADIIAYLCYNEEEKPFPFAGWPQSKEANEEENEKN